ncbi:MAG TPA: M15 family metallopeptidase [Verrucomicrobiae bacterium]|nr:M15 family metallopeptidase [Verrucomicrobiae bacterium]
MTYSRVLSAICGTLLLVVAGCFTTRPSADLVDVQKVIPGIVLDIRYATTNNFTGQQLYPFSKCYLRRASAEKLRAAQAELATMGYGLKIFDGYRPLSVQWKMWEVFPQPGYVADPRKGSRHNRGAAVDVTLIRLSDGTELPMPTPYDDFTEKAHRKSNDLPAEVIHNRDLLERVLTKNGFVGLPTEWWHFDDKDWRQYPIMDAAIPD